jgi:tRNA-Thr(GGU) m(6)t(6)A37 methyltransferase TsaA
MTNTPSSAARPGEATIDLPQSPDAHLHFIGRIRTPFATLADCPKNPREREVEATVELDARYAAGLEGIERFSHLILLYWMDEARRDLVRQTPRHLDAPHGVFALRSPLRPNPVSLAVVELLGVTGTTLRIKGIDCRDRTPLLDIKPYFASTDSVPEATRR